MWNDLHYLYRYSESPEKEFGLWYGYDENSSPEIQSEPPVIYQSENEINEENFGILSANPEKKASKRNTRTCFTNEQVFVMEKTFSECKYLKKKARSDLARILNLSEKNIMIWFQNRRQKSKKEESNSRMVAQMDQFHQTPSYNQQDIKPYLHPFPHYNTYINNMPPQYSDYYNYNNYQNIQPTQNYQLPEYHWPLENYPNYYSANYSLERSDQVYENSNSNTLTLACH